MHTDNKAALASMHNVDMTSSRVKYIDTRHHACKEQVVLSIVAYKFCPSLNDRANCLTNPRAAMDSAKCYRRGASYSEVTLH